MKKKSGNVGSHRTAGDVTSIRRKLFASGLCGKSKVASSVREKLHSWQGTERYILLRGEHGVEFDLALREMIISQDQDALLYPLILDCRKISSTNSISSLSAALRKPDYAGRSLLFLNGETLTVARRVFLGRWLQSMEEEDAVNGSNRVICVTLSGVPAENNCYSLDEDLLHLCANRLLRLPPLRERTEDIPEMIKSIFAVISGQDILNEEALSQQLLGTFQDCMLEGNFDLLLDTITQSSVINGTSTFDVMRFKELIVKMGGSKSDASDTAVRGDDEVKPEGPSGLGSDDFLDAIHGSKEIRKKTGITNIPFEKYVLNLPKD
ncbi:hypothetical protein [Rubellicoccus peritrichatus]|uniref:Sigma-54 factor interaction domain-containing protein n=1 Tax=Rubellicoccus peritrichatus TaxID=3080537 RepID=A0AAQ3QVA7_9BACT|nr:hypothetical protein [Puniceicoccus sp. CR14]WOO41373.1 hypothetical protein RZN69_22365 [Puniceicoccus sp. CR14]